MEGRCWKKRVRLKKNWFLEIYYHNLGFPGGLVVNNPPANAGDTKDISLIPGSERYPGEGNGHPLQYSCLGSPMEKGDWQSTDHGVMKCWTHDLETKH